MIQYLVDKGANLGAYDLGKKNDGAFGASVEPLIELCRTELEQVGGPLFDGFRTEAPATARAKESATHDSSIGEAPGQVVSPETAAVGQTTNG